MKLMLVEDNKKIREMIKKILANSDVTVDSYCECENGLQACEQFPLYHPDWILMDIEMKSMNGFSATENILLFNSDAKIIIVTQYNDPEYYTNAKNLGAKAFVLKENLNDLPGILRSYL